MQEIVVARQAKRCARGGRDVGDLKDCKIADATRAWPVAAPVFAVGGRLIGFGTRSAKAVLRRMVETDENGHEARGGSGSTTASCGLRD